jgi:hypothetical protein
MLPRRAPAASTPREDEIFLPVYLYTTESGFRTGDQRGKQKLVTRQALLNRHSMLCLASIETRLALSS